MRMGILCGLLTLGMGLGVSSAYTLTITDGSRWRELAERQRERRLRLQPKRGTIYDRRGGAFAVSVDVPTVTMDSVELLRGVPRQQIPGVARSAANRIAAALGIDAARVERRIVTRRRFTFLKRRVSKAEVEKVRRLSSSDAGDSRIRGLRVEGEGHRYYPNRELSGSLLGFVGPDGEGKDGLEYSLNDDLKGHVEQLRGLRDRSGRVLLSEGRSGDQALAGNDIYLTIDQGIQFAAERALRNTLRTYEGVGGSVVVVEPVTGEILAMVSLPSYNPNDYRESAVAARRDRAVADRFEPGSTMKIFTVAAGLAGKAIAPTEELYCEKGRMSLDDVVIRDTHPSEWLTISRILAVSSNICAAKIGLSLGGEKLYESLRRFGFGQSPGLPVPSDTTGVLRPRGRPWVQVETASASFGQGISVTNLQMAMATAAIANGGKLMDPIIIKKVVSATGHVLREGVPHVRRQVVSKRIARTVAEMMVSVTEGDGTGVNAAISGFRVAGKTATAQKTDPRTGRYSLDKYVASFVGFVPARNPKVVVSVVVDEPMVDHAGGTVAAPVFRRVAEIALKYYGKTPRNTAPADLAELARSADRANATMKFIRGAESSVQKVVEGGKVGEGQVRIPDMTGWPMREVVRRSHELGVVPTVSGTGLLSKQSPGPGVIVEKGRSLVLVFESPT